MKRLIVILILFTTFISCNSNKSSVKEKSINEYLLGTWILKTPVTLAGNILYTNYNLEFTEKKVYMTESGVDEGKTWGPMGPIPYNYTLDGQRVVIEGINVQDKMFYWGKEMIFDLLSDSSLTFNFSTPKGEGKIKLHKKE